MPPVIMDTWHFNLRSREGSDIITIFYAVLQVIFQSTLSRGERLHHRFHCFFLFDFNPRSREGSDTCRKRNCIQHTISIHAPARGATRVGDGQPVPCCQFQSTLPRGERPRLSSNNNGIIRFQSTLPRGERLADMRVTDTMSYFNPRSREGSDIIIPSHKTKKLNFNPRSREGSDGDFRIYQIATQEISIHAPARGATVCFLHCMITYWNFNPRSREGSDEL